MNTEENQPKETKELIFKKVTAKNWQDVDQAWVALSPAGSEPKTGEEWAEDVLKHTLLEQVPHEVRQLFVVAQGSIVYGYLFYPLIALATEQLYRVAEEAVRLKCLAIDPEDFGKHSKKVFTAKIDWLVKAKGNRISAENKVKWDEIIALRAKASNLDNHYIYSPTDAIFVLIRITGLINALFAPAE